MKPAWPRLTCPANPISTSSPSTTMIEDAGDDQRIQDAAPGKDERQRQQQRHGAGGENEAALALDADDRAMDALLVAHVLARAAPR